MTTETTAVSPRPLAASLYLNLPLLRARIVRGVELYKAGAVEIGALTISVQGSQMYEVTHALVCNCPDVPQAPNGVCKHTIAAGLALASLKELPQQKPTTLATRVLLPMIQPEQPGF